MKEINAFDKVKTWKRFALLVVISGQNTIVILGAIATKKKETNLLKVKRFFKTPVMKTDI